MAKRDVVATEKIISGFDLPERRVLAAIVQFAVDDIRRGNRHAQKAQLFLVSNVFCFMCHVLGLNKSDIQRALLSEDFIAKEGWHESEPMAEDAPPKKSKRRKADNAVQEDAEFDFVGDVSLEPDPEPITYIHTFNSRSI